MILAIAALPGLIFYFVKRARRPELVLWSALWLAIVGSSSVVFFIDGWRALYATHPLMAAFVAIAFTTPSVLRPSQPSHVPMSPGKPLSLAGLAIILLLVAPWAVHRELSPGEPVVRRQHPSVATVLGGSMITGFLVLPDGQAPDQKIASLSHSDFQAVLKSARLDERLASLHIALSGTSLCRHLGTADSQGTDRGGVHFSHTCPGGSRRDALAFRSNTGAEQ